MAETVKPEGWLWGSGDQRLRQDVPSEETTAGKRVKVRGPSSSGGNNDSAVYAHWRVRRYGDEANTTNSEAETGWENHRSRWRNTFQRNSARTSLTLENGARGVNP